MVWWTSSLLSVPVKPRIRTLAGTTGAGDTGGTGPGSGTASETGAITGAAIFGCTGLLAVGLEAHAPAMTAIAANPSRVIECARRCAFVTCNTTARSLPEARTQGKRHAQSTAKNPISSTFQFGFSACLDDRT